MITMTKIALKTIIKYIVLFIAFGGIYYLIESIYKGFWTDPRMIIMAGIIGLLIGLVNNLFSFDTNFILQCFVGMMIAILSEAICGYQWNIVEKLALWDYNNLPFSYVGGQINLFFALAWFVLSAVCIYLDDYIRYRFFNEEKPHYTIKA